MSPSLPLCCPPRAFNLLARQIQAIDSPDALLQGAIAISMQHMEAVDPAAVDATLQSYADVVRSRVRGRQPQAVLAHLHELLFDDLNFGGSFENYYDPANSYLPAVLDRKRGLPITLSLIYKIVAERLGLRAWGVGVPGHFLVGVEIDGAPILIDPFSRGRLVTSEEAEDRVRGTFGVELQWSDELLRPASNRHWLTRILQNLLNVFGNEGRFAEVAAILEMEMVLWPEQNHLKRDLGLVLARCGLSQPASAWLDRYLQTNPDDPQTLQIRELLQVLST